MQGLLLFVSGLSGSGKTTLIRHALENSTNLIYLTTVTTRPQRENETNTEEYAFITDDEYENARARSKEWDHTEYNGYKYGADTAFIKQKLRQGTDVICSVVPDMADIKKMAELYNTNPVTIWIDTPKHVSRTRVSGDHLRSSRLEDEGVKQHFDYIFRPTGSLSVDQSAFLQALRGWR